MKILITGSNGLLGQKMVADLQKDNEVQLIATSRGKNRLKDKSGYEYYSLDITNEEEVVKCMEKFKPDVIVNTAAMTNVDACENDKQGCDQLNIAAVEHLLNACAKHKSHLVHLSTDFIFDGEDGPYKEEDKPNPLSYYGHSKLKAEKLIQESSISWSILRTVLVYGVAEEMSRSNIVLWAKGALEKGQAMKVVDDQFRTPTLAEDLSQGTIAAAKLKAQGIFNISGDDYLSVLEIIEGVAEFWKLSLDNVTVVSSATLSQDAMRPPRTGFILDKAKKELNYKPHSFQEGLAVVDSQLAAN